MKKSWRRRSRATQMLIQQLVQTDNKENIKIPHNRPLWGNPPANGEGFYAMRSHDMKVFAVCARDIGKKGGASWYWYAVCFRRIRSFIFAYPLNSISDYIWFPVALEITLREISTGATNIGPIFVWDFLTPWDWSAVTVFITPLWRHQIESLSALLSLL